MSKLKVAYCLCHWNRLKKLQKVIRLTSPHVDKTIVVDGGSTDGSLEWLNSQECKDLNVETIVRPWDDNPPGARNSYIEAALRAGMDWILVTDDDEYLEEPALFTIKQLIDQKEKEGVTLIRFNSHDIQTTADGSVWENKSSYWNPMCFKLGPSVKYHGHTHVGISSLSGGIYDSPFRYFHIKSVPEQWLRGARNYWTTSKPAANTRDNEWQHFKNLCNKYQLNLFADIVALMRAGTVPKELTDWFIEKKDNENAEIRSYFVTYFIYLHPELNTGISNIDFPFTENRKPFIDIYF